MTTLIQALDRRRRSAPVDLPNSPPDSPERFVDEQDQLHLAYADLEWVRLRQGAPNGNFPSENLAPRPPRLLCLTLQLMA